MTPAKMSGECARNIAAVYDVPTNHVAIEAARRQFERIAVPAQFDSRFAIEGPVLCRWLMVEALLRHSKGVGPPA